MATAKQQSTSIVANDRNDDSAEMVKALADLHSLQRQVVDAWKARAVLFTPEERRALRHEIRETCAILEELVAKR